MRIIHYVMSRVEGRVEGRVEEVDERHFRISGECTFKPTALKRVNPPKIAITQ